MQLNLPKDIGELTVKQFQDLTVIYNSDKDLLDKGVEAISLLSGVPEKDVWDIDYKEIGKLFTHVSTLMQSKPKEGLRKWIVCNGKVYKAVTDISKISTGQYLDLKNLSKDDNWIVNMHLLLGCLYLPVNWYGKAKKYNGEKLPEISKDLLTAKLKDVYGLLFFYSAVLEKLSPIIQMSLEEALQTIQETLTEINNDSQVS